MVKKEKKITIKYTTYNNKSRKGKYIYIKEKDKKPKRFKFKDNLKESDYIYAYKKNVDARRGGITPEKIKYKKKLEKSTKLFDKRYPKTDDALNEGYAEYTFKARNYRFSPSLIREAYKNVLLNEGKARDGKPIVKDNELINILTLPENIQKWKHRVSHEISLLGDQDDKILAVINEKGIKSLVDIKKDIIDKIPKGMEMGEFSKTIRDKLERNGYSVNMQSGGKIRDIKIRMIFRKAKL